MTEVAAVPVTTPSVSKRHPDIDTPIEELNLLAAFQADPRPTFVVDTASPEGVLNLRFSYINPSLVENKDLLLCLQKAVGRHDTFSTWVMSVSGQDRYYRYGGALWFGFSVDSRWKVISTASPVSAIDPRQRGTTAIEAPRPVSSTAPGWATLAGEEHAQYQAKISRLEEEHRLLEFGRKAAVKEKADLIGAIKKLEARLETCEVSRSTTNLPRTRSDDFLCRLAHSPPKHESHLGAHSTSLHDPHKELESSRLRQSTFRMPVSKSDTVSRPLRSDGNETNDAFLALEKFKRLAEMVDVGFFDYDTTGKLVHANESWYVLSGHPREPEKHTSLSFMDCVFPEDREIVANHWASLIQGYPVTFEMRWKKPSLQSNDPILASDAQWVLAACVPVMSEDGQVRSISGCTTDINFQKHTAAVALQKAEALERARASEERFARLAAVAPIAIFRFDRHKNVEYCNDRWFEMTGLPKTRFEDIAYPFGVLDDDIDLCMNAWDRVIQTNGIGTLEFRLRKEWHDAHGRHGQTWVHCTFFPEYSEDGEFQGLMGSMLNISHIKWAENMSKLRAEEALEAKRQQEAFIDVTSHEMRNPLSAMVQCADSIVGSLAEVSAALGKWSRQPSDERAKLQESLDASLDATQTILSCAAHQKRIVDDILTLSKLDSNLLLITPVKTQPVQMVRDVIKMFEMDCKKADVQLRSVVDRSFTDLYVDWLTLDPSRVLQILINLLTNAIKFTRDEQARQVTIGLSVSQQPPSKHASTVEYIPAETVTDDFGCGGDWGSGESIYLLFEVQDTGRGLTDKEKQKLFQRFSQASPKTHVQYGGSGLGLFISRKLTEMQGGEIGFASTSQVGSTFAFYVKTRRTDAPTQAEDLCSHPVARVSSRPMKEPLSKRKDFNILLVEDNVVNQRVLKQQLVRLGCKVHVAGHGGEALDFLKTTRLWATSKAEDCVPLDIVLMDIEMPIMGGLECTSEIRKLEVQGLLRRHLPIISISANARVEQVSEARKAGVDDCITKPFRIAELMPKLQILAP